MSSNITSDVSSKVPTSERAEKLDLTEEEHEAEPVSISPSTFTVEEPTAESTKEPLSSQPKPSLKENEVIVEEAEEEVVRMGDEKGETEEMESIEPPFMANTEEMIHETQGGSLSASSTTPPEATSPPSITISEDVNPNETLTSSYVPEKDVSTKLSTTETIDEKGTVAPSETSMEPPTKVRKLSSGEEETLSQEPPFYELKIAITGHNFYRVVRMSSQTTLDKMHQLIMNLFKWSDSKPHKFLGHGRTYGPKDESDLSILDEKGYQLSQLLIHEKASIKYNYDLEKQWEVQITLQDVLNEKPEDQTQDVVCLSGRGGEIDEQQETKTGKFSKTDVNTMLESFKIQ